MRLLIINSRSHTPDRLQRILDVLKDTFGGDIAVFRPQLPWDKSRFARFFFFVLYPVWWIMLNVQCAKIIQQQNISHLLCIGTPEKLLLKAHRSIIWLEAFWFDFSWIAAWRYRRKARKARIVCLSEALQQQIRTLGINARNLSVIHSFLPQEQFEQTQEWLQLKSLFLNL